MEQQNNKHDIGLSLLRVILGFIVLKNIIFFFPTAYYYFGQNGIAPWKDFILSCTSLHTSFIAIFFSNEFLLKIYLLIAGVCAFNFCLGIGSTLNGVIFYFLYFFLKIRNGLLLDGSDNVISVILPFLILSNCYTYFNHETKYDSWEKKLRQKNFLVAVNQVLTLGILIQVVFVYFFTAVAKSEGLLWQNGTAVYYTMRVKEFMATSWNIPLTQNVYFVVLSTYGTLLVEIAFPFLIWFRKTKFYVMIAAALLHIGVFIFMRIDNFSWVMITTYLAFISDSEYTNAKVWAENFIGRITVFKKRLLNR